MLIAQLMLRSTTLEMWRSIGRISFVLPQSLCPRISMDHVASGASAPISIRSTRAAKLAVAVKRVVFVGEETEIFSSGGFEHFVGADACS